MQAKSTSNATDNSGPDFLLSGAIIALIVLFWGLRLNTSLWLDETLTYWIIKDSPLDAIERAFTYQGQSPFYFLLLNLLSIVLGVSEPALRLLSIISAVGALYYVYKIIAKLFDSDRAGLTVLLLISTDIVTGAAVSARPYAPGFMAAMAATYSFLRWHDSGKLSEQLVYLAWMLLAVYDHYIFLPVIFIHFLYYILFNSDSRITLAALFLTALFLLIGLLPLYLHFQYLLGRAAEISVSAKPGLLSIGGRILDPATALLFIVAFFYTQAFSAKRPDITLIKKELTTRKGLFLVCWSFLPVLGLFCLSYLLKSGSLFSKRYLIWCLPATAALLSLVAISFKNKNALRTFVISFSALVLITAVGRPITGEDWRGAVRYINTLSLQDETALLFYSSLIESKNIEWFSDPGHRDYLLGPLNYYKVRKKVLFLPPPIKSINGRHYVEDNILPVLKGQQACTALGLNVVGKSGLGVSDWVKSLCKKSGFSDPQVKKFGRVFVIVAAREPPEEGGKGKK
ncbi:MAG: hypothetical protein D6719_03380 [Candidatus Dadabacteria bacterium]|nr:MAG: hypothetical protein D6719_03380 [Candidatus Dadabacteria bacterium]